tara:strand:+ start:1145 stop:1483 length:339 start_codon:yes stop_codon:yes gene_type:complete
MTITYNDIEIKINLTELVAVRASFIGEEMTEEEVDELATDLKHTLTWDTLYGMIDNAILDYYDKLETHYGEIQPEPGREEYLNEIEKNKKQFEMVDLVSPSWTIQVPRRKKK